MVQKRLHAAARAGSESQPATPLKENLKLLAIESRGAWYDAVAAPAALGSESQEDAPPTHTPHLPPRVSQLLR